MATHHAAPAQLVDLRTWADDLPTEKSKVILKAKQLELARLVIDAGVDMHHSDYCRVAGESVIHCIEGEIKVKTPEKTFNLREGQLTFLDSNMEHALQGVEKSVVLLTITLT